ncbi:MAG: DnaJ domain-containing protein [Clostridiales bacterium]|jgi:DnaJ-class molecular chaperone|nr:DnaJ domain-containing protein [Clostridiales bacterium]
MEMLQKQWEVKWQDYYQVLGLNRDATIEQITSAHKKLRKKWHPDVVTSKNDEALSNEYSQMFANVSLAGEYLLDETEKAIYDKAWDARQNPDYIDPGINMFTEYSDEEKYEAKKEAIREIVKQKADEIKLVDESITELTFQAYDYQGEDAEAVYHQAYTNLIRTITDFKKELESLAKEAKNYDLKD